MLEKDQENMVKIAISIYGENLISCVCHLHIKVEVVMHV